MDTKWRVVVDIGDAPNIMSRFWDFRLKPTPEAIGLCVSFMCQVYELMPDKAPNEG